MIKKTILAVACIFAAHHIPCYSMDTPNTTLNDPIFYAFFCRHPHSENSTNKMNTGQKSYFHTQPEEFLRIPSPTRATNTSHHHLAGIIKKMEEQMLYRMLQKIQEENHSIQQTTAQITPQKAPTSTHIPHVPKKQPQKYTYPQKVASYRQAKTFKCPIDKIIFSSYQES